MVLFHQKLRRDSTSDIIDESEQGEGQSDDARDVPYALIVFAQNRARMDVAWREIMPGLMQTATGFFREGFDIVRMIKSSQSEKANAWDWSIARFEAQDLLQPPLPGVIVFTGSSSITFWSTLEQDMAPMPVVNRGFGGSKIHQVTYYVNRVVIPYNPRAVVLFAGTNDISGTKPKSAKQVFEGYLEFVNSVHASLSRVPIYYVSITPTPSRWKLWPIVCEANRLIQAHTETDERLHFIDLTPSILGPDGRPDRSLFRIDRLHPNKKGYAEWTRIIKPVLQAEFSKGARQGGSNG